MLRIWFATEDLGRVRVARQPHALWEMVLSLQTLQTGQRTVLSGWRDAALTRLASPRSSAALRVLRPLVPARGYFPDFLTPAGGEGTIADGIAAVLNTPRRRVAVELERLAAEGHEPTCPARVPGDGTAAVPGAGRPARERDRGPPNETGLAPPGSVTWVAETLASGRRLGPLGDALAHYHRAALAPYMPRMRALVDADRAVRARAVLDGGVEALLDTLRPVLRWRPPVLEATIRSTRSSGSTGAVCCWCRRCSVTGHRSHSWTRACPPHSSIRSGAAGRTRPSAPRPTMCSAR